MKCRSMQKRPSALNRLFATSVERFNNGILPLACEIIFKFVAYWKTAKDHFHFFELRFIFSSLRSFLSCNYLLFRSFASDNFLPRGRNFSEIHWSILCRIFFNYNGHFFNFRCKFWSHNLFPPNSLRSGISLQDLSSVYTEKKEEENQKSHLFGIVDKVKKDLITVKSPVSVTLPSRQKWVGLNILNSEPTHRRRRAEFGGIKVEKIVTFQFGWLLATQQTTRRRCRLVHRAHITAMSRNKAAAATAGGNSCATADTSADEFLVIPQPLPELLRLASTM